MTHYYCSASQTHIVSHLFLLVYVSLRRMNRGNYVMNFLQISCLNFWATSGCIVAVGGSLQDGWSLAPRVKLRLNLPFPQIFKKVEKIGRSITVNSTVHGPQNLLVLNKIRIDVLTWHPRLFSKNMHTNDLRNGISSGLLTILPNLSKSSSVQSVKGRHER